MSYYSSSDDEEPRLEGDEEYWAEKDQEKLEHEELYEKTLQNIRNRLMDTIALSIKHSLQHTGGCNFHDKDFGEDYLQ